MGRYQYWPEKLHPNESFRSLLLTTSKRYPHHKVPTESIKISPVSTTPKRKRKKRKSSYQKKIHQTQLQGNFIHHTAKEGTTIMVRNGKEEPQSFTPPAQNNIKIKRKLQLPTP